MPRIAGSSQYLNQATLANKQGSTYVPADILSLSSSASLLDAGRGTAVSGIGISARARQLNNQIIANNSSSYNKLFSLSGGASATTAAAQIQIAGLASTALTSRSVTLQDDGSFSSGFLDVDDGSVASSALGTEVDETA
ncbi:MAG: hypothetical protein COB36_05955 [Alphaproteobacteria bacterium]|nr:MAG: hypothetical protein COB36_05955 [Alphaproteobacteria bacterium]